MGSLSVAPVVDIRAMSAGALRCLLLMLWTAPPNRGGLNSAHIHGTHVPVVEPSTASEAVVVTSLFELAGRTFTKCRIAVQYCRSLIIWGMSVQYSFAIGKSSAGNLPEF